MMLQFVASLLSLRHYYDIRDLRANLQVLLVLRSVTKLVNRAHFMSNSYCFCLDILSSLEGTLTDLLK